MSPPVRSYRPGFAIAEVVVSLLIVGVLLVIFSVAASDSRRNSSVSADLNNLKQFAWAGSTYAADCSDRFWTFSWTRLDNPTGQPFVDDQTAAAAQAIDIIQRRTNISVVLPASWVPHIQYSPLVLVDQLNLRLPLPWAISPGDSQRRQWQQCADAPNPNECFLALPLTQRPSEGSAGEVVRYMVSSSYQIGPSFISRDQRESPNSTLQSALTNHYTYSVGTLPLGDRLMTQVAHPSRKAVMWDVYQRNFGRRVAFFAYDEARVPILMADGAALVRATSEANPGFYPNVPANADPLRYSYVPRVWEFPTMSGSPSQLVTGHYQWTRGGLTGRDFGDAEVCTGQPGCTP